MEFGGSGRGGSALLSTPRKHDSHKWEGSSPGREKVGVKKRASLCMDTHKWQHAHPSSERNPACAFENHSVAY